MPSTRLLLLDDHILFREGLSRLLGTEPDFTLVAQCSTPSEALVVLRNQNQPDPNQPGQNQPVDVVLLDFDLEDDTGTRFMSAAKAAGYAGKILMVTAGMSPLDTVLVQQQGVSGIFLKHSPPALLLQAIRTVANGGKWFDTKIDAKFEPRSDSGDESNSAAIPGALLTPREQQVLRGVFEGLSNKEIAYQIDVSQSSVKATLQQLFEKTGVRTRSQLVRIALERSLEGPGRRS
jgi:DNA-binding NarL/FixJ family response regulator